MLLPRFNRSRAILWILVPLLLEMQFTLFSSFFDLLGNNFTVVFVPAMIGTIFSIAGLWLLLPVLNKKYLLATFFYTFMLMEIFACLAGIFYTESEDDMSSFMVGVLLFLTVFSASISLSFILSVRSCHRHKTPLAFMGWFAVWLLAIWTVIMIVISIMAGSLLPLLLIPIAAFFCFLALFPYLLLALLHPFYTKRLMDFIDNGEKSVPPVTQTAGPSAP